MTSATGQLKVLALDPAIHCGFAHSCGVSGTIDLSVRRDESTGFRLIRLRGKLNEIYNSCGVDVLVFEAARNAGGAGALVVQSEIQGVIKLWCTDLGIEYRGYSPSEIKRHATGKGTANKQAMLEAARAKWPHVKIERDDQADALWLLDLAMSG